MNASKVVDHIVDWLNDYSIKAGTKGFVVGVSGGIDSAVTSSLAARTGKPTLCLEMPILQGESQVTLAQSHIKMLQAKHNNVSGLRVDLTPVFEQFIGVVPPVDNEDDRFMSLANTRARLRMSTLYYFAALNGYLLAGTGNKVEDFGVGFYTKYGDGGVDLSPIADLMKTEVFAIGKEMDVIEEIIQAAPTDGLWCDGRTDEDQLGASYPELEWAMGFMDANGKESELDGRQKEVLAIYRKHHNANRHKMDAIPVCIVPDSVKA